MWEGRGTNTPQVTGVGTKRWVAKQHTVFVFVNNSCGHGPQDSPLLLNDAVCPTHVPCKVSQYEVFPTSGHGELPAPCVSCRVQTITPTWPGSNTRRNGALSQVASRRKCKVFFSLYDSGSVKECARTEYYCLTTRRAIVGDRKEEEGGGTRADAMASWPQTR